MAKKGRRVVGKAVKSKVARDFARREMEIAADMMMKAAKEMKEKARKMK